LWWQRTVLAMAVQLLRTLTCCAAVVTANSARAPGKRDGSSPKTDDTVNRAV
jgi:hypothetical protein